MIKSDESRNTKRFRPRWFYIAPHWPDNPSLSRQAFLTLTILRYIFIGLAIVVFLSLFSPHNNRFHTLVVYSPIVLGILGCVYLLRRGFVHFAGWLLSWLIWILITSVSWFFGGLREQNATCYVVVVMVAAATIHSRAAILFAVLSTVVCGFFALAQTQHWMPPSLIAPNPFNAWTSITVALLLVSLLNHLSIRSRDSALQSAIDNENKHRKAAAELRHEQARNKSRARYDAAAGRLGEMALSGQSLDEFANAAAQLTLELLAVDQVIILQSSHNRQTLSCLSGAGIQYEHMAPFAIESNSAVARVLERGQPEVIHDPNRSGLAPVMTSSNLHSGIIASIPNRTRSPALICVLHRQSRSFHENDLSFLSMLTGLLDAAIERDAAESRLREMQKLEVVGRLASGIAHDFNNLLTVITGVSSLLRDDLQEPDDIEMLDDLDAAAERAVLMTGRLLAFNRSQAPPSGVCDLNAVVHSNLPIFARLVGEDIEIRHQRNETNLYVGVDRASVEQIVLNLAVNARDAMPNGGQLIINTGISQNSRETQSRVFMTIEDTGIGMDPEICDRIFEPFFSTKQGGTGLGLATVHDIIRRTNGTIHAHSQPNSGACFRLEFPTANMPARESGANQVSKNVHRSENILLVEDNDLVRATISRVLANKGYIVMTADNGDTALNILSDHTFDLIVSDIRMPRVGGSPLIDELCRRNARTPIIFISGHADDSPPEDSNYKGQVRFLRKPFSNEALLAVIDGFSSSKSQSEAAPILDQPRHV